MQASARDDLDCALSPEDYRQLLDWDVDHPLVSHGHNSLSYVDINEVNAIEQCYRLVATLQTNPCLKSLITMATGFRDRSKPKRKRDTGDLEFPKHDSTGSITRRINQGPGGDLIFDPTPSPIVCKQSCTYQATYSDLNYKFTSYVVYAVEEFKNLTEASEEANTVAEHAKQSAAVSIQSISTPDPHTAVKTLTLTSIAKHHLKSQATYGYLHGLEDKIEQTGFKVFTAKHSPPTFEIKLDNRTNLGDLEAINSSIASGLRTVEFRNILGKNVNKYLIHTILTSPEHPQPSGEHPQPSGHQSQQVPSTAMQTEPAIFGTTLEPLSSQFLLPGSDTFPPASDNTTLQNLHVLNNAQVDGTLTYTHAVQLSDQRIKENIVSNPTDALHKLRQLRPYAYNLVSCPSKDPEVGYLAQQVQAVLPEAVKVDAASGLLGLSQYTLLVRAIEGIQQLYDTQQEHSAEIKTLKAQDDAQCLGMQVLKLVSCHTPDQDTADIPEPADAHGSQQDTAESNLASNSSNADTASAGVRNEATVPSITGNVQPVPFGGKTDPSDITQFLMSAMKETSVNLCAKFSKGLSIVGPEAMWECYQAACKEEEEEKGKLYRNFLLQMERRKKDVRSRAAAQEVSASMQTPLRGFQQKLVQAAKVGNHIIVLPTGTGKTRIVVELAHQMLQANPQSRIVVLTPTTTLAQQQQGAFMAGLSQTGATSDCFFKDNPVNSSNWATSIAQTSVMVMTAQMLLNVLRLGVASLRQISLLVVDECHHSYNDHPFNDVLAFNRQQTPAEQHNTQIIGLTASPGNGRSMAEAYAKQEAVRSNMCATFLSLSDTQDLQQYAPDPEYVLIHVAPRQQDSTFACNLAMVIRMQAESLTASLPDSSPLSCLTDMQMELNESSFCPGLQGWLDRLLTSPSLPGASRPVATLLRACNTALSIAKDTGYEGALHFLGSACAEADKSAQHARPETAAQPGTAQHGAAQQAQQDEAQDKAAQQAKDSVPAASAFGDSPIASFLKALSAKVCNLSNVVDCLRSVHTDGQVHGSSKFQELVHFLVKLKAQKEVWHGMVFVRERQAVFQLTKMLQSVPQLAAINFHPFTGQAKTHSVRSASGNTSSSATPLGMKTSERKNTFQRFRFAKGREVLVATSAAEEGIDVPGCEFVVCYTTVGSGRELTQKQGRARAMVSKFVEFVESNTDDNIMQRKARSEQLSSQLAQQLHLRNAKCC